jgi:hypothetical protein
MESDRCAADIFIPGAKEIWLDCSEPVVEPALEDGSTLLVEANRICMVDIKPIRYQISLLTRGPFWILRSHALLASLLAACLSPPACLSSLLQQQLHTTRHL